MKGELRSRMRQVIRSPNFLLYIAATFILNDDVESAEAELAKGHSTFHNVGVTAPLGLEPASGLCKLIWGPNSWGKEW